MSDKFTKEKRSQIMAAVKSSGNRATELRLLMIFRKYRITGWRRNFKILGKPDFVFPKAKLAIFVDGCFWHGCRKHLRMPSNNRNYWQRKIARNMDRDRAASIELRKSGWRVLRIWEHELSFDEFVARRLTKALSEVPVGVRMQRGSKHP